MHFRIFLAWAALLAVAAGAAVAADITGSWTGTPTKPDQRFSLKFKFKQDGEKLTGTVSGEGFGPVSFTDGKVQGDKLTFSLRVEARGADSKAAALVFNHEGTIKGNQITLTTKVEDGQDFPGGPMTLKRDK